jgi:RNA polymerase sigma factor (sigma-70 family)
MVLGLCQRLLRDTHAAEDALQATFLTLVRKGGSISKRESVGSWLYKVAYRIALRAKARADERAALEKPLAGLTLAGAFPEPGQEAGRREMQEALDMELNSLPEKYRAPIVLCYLEGKSFSEAAQELGWAKGTVSTRIGRARELLCRRLTRRGLGLCTGGMETILGECSAPALPGALVTATVKAAVSFAAGQGAMAGVISAEVAGLTKGALQAMLVAKLKAAVALVLALTLVASGAWGLSLWTLAVKRQPVAGDAPNLVIGDGEQPKAEGTTPPRIDRYGDPLPQGALLRLGTVRFRQIYPSSIAFSPDGRMLAAGGFDNSLRLWEPTTGKETRRFVGHEGSVNSVAFSSDGKTIVSGSQDGSVCLWEVATGKAFRKFESEHRAPVYAVALSPEGKIVAFGNLSAVRLGEVATGKLYTFSGPQATSANPLAFSPDGTILAAASSSEIYLWQVATGKQLPSLVAPRSSFMCIAFTGDGKTLVSGSSDHVVRFWDVASAKERRRIVEQSNGIQSLALSPDGKTLAVGTSWDDRYVSVWELATGKPLYQFKGYGGYVSSLAYSPNSRILAAACQNTIHLWEVTTGKELQASDSHQGEVKYVTYAPDGKLLATVGDDLSIRLWDRASGTEVLRLPCPRGRFDPSRQRLVFSPTGKVLATADGMEGTISFWEVPTGRRLRQFPKQQSFIVSLAFSPDGASLAAAYGDNQLLIWDVATGRVQSRFKMDQRAIVAVTFSPDGKILASVGADEVCLLDPATGRKLHHFGPVVSRHFGKRDWNPSIAWSPDNKTLAAGGSWWGASDSLTARETAVRLWEVASGRERFGFLAHPKGVLSVAFDRTGKILASGSNDGTIYLRNLKTGEAVAQFRGHEGWITSLAFSPDGKELASAGADTSVLIWDVTGYIRDRQPSVVRLSPQELQHLWDDLASEDESRACRSFWTLARAPEQAVSLLEQQLRLIAAADGHVAQLVAELGDDRFAIREKADAELEKLGTAAKPALETALQNRPGLEAANRVKRLLARLQGKGPSPEQLRVSRAIEVLEQIGTPQVQRLLQSFAKGVPGSLLTQEANAALDCLEKRTGKQDRPRDPEGRAFHHQWRRVAIRLYRSVKALRRSQP